MNKIPKIPNFFEFLKPCIDLFLKYSIIFLFSSLKKYVMVKIIDDADDRRKLTGTVSHFL